MLHLDHISRVLAIPPELFDEDQMWKRSPASTPAMMKKEDMNIFFATRMNSVGEDAWEKTLKRPSGRSLFTWERNWADGSKYVSEHCSVADLWLTAVQWTLASMFDMQGWLIPKLDLAVAFIHWTIHFLFDHEIEGCWKAKKGVDYYLTLWELLGIDEKTEKVYQSLSIINYSELNGPYIAKAYCSIVYLVMCDQCIGNWPRCG